MVDRERLERRIVRVAELADERLADYRQLREADIARGRGAFIAESEVVLRVLIGCGRHSIRSVLIAASRLDKLADALVRIDTDVPIYVAEQELLNEVVGFRIHRGILASGQRQPPPAPADLVSALPAAASRLVLLEGLTNHDNVGGVFRNAAAFGVDAVMIDRETCDPLYRKSIRVSVGGALLLPWGRAESSAEMIAAARGEGFTVVALSPRVDAVELMDFCYPEPPERVALLLGTEGAGLRPETMEAADALVRIDIEPGFDSLNVATASGIALHALRRR